ncbi:uncharacterized protein SPSK_10088 [Sporothrix schenckii 1099-18]|uniref:Uncharacterized protein n=1 Tax=Sporothrix schenckii 1099-18 TaxID=1397361 RepID=A0A0F2M9Y5_SPOSC|nr:uncharacterized protein SPSK_10088 [Sporothrix schenckii 1099-18]KJR85914.1 hypothetical protein SPSK_10088 [Sporothrix schenckii 1099-18]
MSYDVEFPVSGESVSDVGKPFCRRHHQHSRSEMVCALASHIASHILVSFFVNSFASPTQAQLPPSYLAFVHFRKLRHESLFFVGAGYDGYALGGRASLGPATSQRNSK